MRGQVIPLGLLALALGGCSTLLGGNVKGSFSCRAPGGTCAPTARIDDLALKEITSEDGPSVADRGSPGPAAVMRPMPGPAARSREKVLRIVFPAYIDERGRLHEASAVRAVVAQGDWEIGSAPMPNQAADVGRSPGGGSLAEAVESALPPGAPAATAEAVAPTAEAVAAARALKPQPGNPVSIDAIKAEVDAQLGAKAGAARKSAPTAIPSGTPPAGPSGGASAPAPKPSPSPSPGPAVRAPGFPGGVVEDPR